MKNEKESRFPESFGSRLVDGGPIVFKDPEGKRIPEIMYEEGKEKEAIKLLEKLGVIKIFISGKN